MVYQRDLGKETDAISSSMKIFDPDSVWKKTEVPPDNTAPQPKGR